MELAACMAVADMVPMMPTSAGKDGALALLESMPLTSTAESNRNRCRRSATRPPYQKAFESGQTERRFPLSQNHAPRNYFHSIHLTLRNIVSFHHSARIPSSSLSPSGCATPSASRLPQAGPLDQSKKALGEVISLCRSSARATSSRSARWYSSRAARAPARPRAAGSGPGNRTFGCRPSSRSAGTNADRKRSRCSGISSSAQRHGVPCIVAQVHRVMLRESKDRRIV